MSAWSNTVKLCNALVRSTSHFDFNSTSCLQFCDGLNEIQDEERKACCVAALVAVAVPLVPAASLKRNLSLNTSVFGANLSKITTYVSVLEPYQFEGSLERVDIRHD